MQMSGSDHLIFVGGGLLRSWNLFPGFISFLRGTVLDFFSQDHAYKTKQIFMVYRMGQK